MRNTVHKFFFTILCHYYFSKTNLYLINSYQEEKYKLIFKKIDIDVLNILERIEKELIIRIYVI